MRNVTLHFLCWMNYLISSNNSVSHYHLRFQFMVRCWWRISLNGSEMVECYVVNKSPVTSSVLNLVQAQWCPPSRPAGTFVSFLLHDFNKSCRCWCAAVCRLEIATCLHIVCNVSLEIKVEFLLLLKILGHMKKEVTADEMKQRSSKWINSPGTGPSQPQSYLTEQWILLATQSYFIVPEFWTSLKQKCYRLRNY